MNCKMFIFSAGLDFLFSVFVLFYSILGLLVVYGGKTGGLVRYVME